MLEDIHSFIKRVPDFDDLKSSSKVDYLALFCSASYPHIFLPKEIDELFKNLRLVPLTNLSRYFNENSNKAKTKKKVVKFLKLKSGFQLTSQFQNHLSSSLKIDEVPFLEFTINQETLDWKPSDIPLLNSKIRKNAEFFTKLYYLLYHLENSLRKFLQTRLNSILGNNWESQLIEKVNLRKAVAIKNETDSAELIADRGENILYYCMWDDYGSILKEFPVIFKTFKENDEIAAHLSSLSKIRNSVAHNTSTIPKEYQDELTIFVKKFIRIIKSNGS